MKKAVSLPLVIAVLLFGAYVYASADTAQNDIIPIPRFAPGELIVKLRAPAAKDSDQKLMEKLASIHGFKRAQLLSKKPHKQWNRIYKVQLKEGDSPVQAALELEKESGIEWAEPNYRRKVQWTTPNDPSYSSQSFLWRVDSPTAWDTVKGSRDVVVAIVDTGVQWNHPDLAGNIWTNTGEVPGDGMDNDGNGYIDDVRGWDFVSVDASQVAAGEDPGPTDNDPSDFHGHGTHVAGIVGAVGDNGTGGTGINWQVSIMPLRAGYKTADGGGSLEVEDIANALIYAADNGADIVNMSFGGYEFTHTEKEAMDYCVSAGVLLVAAAGNDQTDRPLYPGAFDEVVAVGALSYSSSNYRASFSNFGVWVDIFAPGESIYSTMLGSTYGYMSGTSMATPVVAGVAGLIKAANPTWTADEIRRKLESTTASLSSSNPDFVGLLGSGKPAAGQAVSGAPTDVKLTVGSFCTQETSGVSDGYLDPGEDAKLLISVRNFSLPRMGVSVSISTSDAYLTITDNTSFVGLVNTGRMKTNWDDPMYVHIASGCPKDHLANLTVQVSSAGTGSTASETIRLLLNPTLRNSVQISEQAVFSEFREPKVVARPDGGVVVLAVTNNFSRNDVYARTADASGAWGPLVQLSANPLLAGRLASGAVSSEGRVHVCFLGITGSWKGEIFYAYQDPGGVWSTPIAVTNGARIVDLSIPDYDAPNTLAVDHQGNPHIVYADYRSGSPELKHVYNDGTGWHPETSIALPSDHPKELRLVFAPDGTGYLTWYQPTVKGFYMSIYAQGMWSAPTQVIANLQGAQYDTVVDNQGSLCLVYHAPDANDTSCIRYNNGTWSAPVVVLTNTYAHDFPLVLKRDASGLLHLVQLAVPGLGSGDITTHFYENTFNGSAWSPMSQLTFDRMDDFTASNTDFTINAVGTKSLVYTCSTNIELGPSGQHVFIMNANTDPDRLPTRPVVTDQGVSTSDPNTLYASWSSSHPSGITEYEYAVGSAPGESDKCYWTPTGTAASVAVDFTDNPLLDGQTYYVSVRAKNSIGYWSPFGTSDGVTADYAEQATTPEEVKAAPEGRQVNITGSAVTAAFTDYFYIEADDRSSGICVESPGHNISADTRADVFGTVKTNADGERVIGDAAASGYGASSIEPLGLTNMQIGGGPYHLDAALKTGQEGIGGAAGLNNTGILVRTCGRVVNSNNIASWNLDSNPNWSMQGQWAYGIPTGQGARDYGKPDPISGHTGTKVYGVNLNGDYSTTVGGPWYLMTGPVNCTGSSNITLKFWRWLNTETQPYAYATIEVSNNGSTWTTIWQNTSSTLDATWKECSYDISSVAANQPTIYIRWGYRIGNYAYSMSGWNIDDIQVTGENRPVIIDDGSGINLELLMPQNVSAPPVGSYVSVTGISSCKRGTDGKLNRLLRVRKAEDVTAF